MGELAIGGESIRRLEGADRLGEALSKVAVDQARREARAIQKNLHLQNDWAETFWVVRCELPLVDGSLVQLSRFRPAPSEEKRCGDRSLIIDFTPDGNLPI